MGLSALDDPNCHPKQHSVPNWAENFVKKKRKTVITKCAHCESVIEVQYKPALVVKELERGSAPLDRV